MLVQLQAAVGTARPSARRRGFEDLLGRKKQPSCPFSVECLPRAMMGGGKPSGRPRWHVADPLLASFPATHCLETLFNVLFGTPVRAKEPTVRHEAPRPRVHDPALALTTDSFWTRWWGGTPLTAGGVDTEDEQEGVYAPLLRKEGPLASGASARSREEPANILVDGIDTVLDVELDAAERGTRASGGVHPPRSAGKSQGSLHMSIGVGGGFGDDDEVDMVGLGVFEADNEILGADVMMGYFEEHTGDDEVLEPRVPATTPISTAAVRDGSPTDTEMALEDEGLEFDADDDDDASPLPEPLKAGSEPSSIVLPRPASTDPPSRTPSSMRTTAPSSIEPFRRASMDGGDVTDSPFNVERAVRRIDDDLDKALEEVRSKPQALAAGEVPPKASSTSDGDADDGDWSFGASTFDRALEEEPS
jgi:hypothetical protein